MENRRVAWDLFLVSALGLFVELMFIRWVASEVRVVAFYKNFALIAAFLGLGIGFAIARREKSVRWFDRWFLPLLSLSVIIVLILGAHVDQRSHFTQSPKQPGIHLGRGCD